MDDEATGLHYMLEPSPWDLARGVIPYNPELHSNLWTYVTIGNITYTNIPELVDWDESIMEWEELSIEQWPFGNPIPEDERIMKDMVVCFCDLDFFLENEEWVTYLLPHEAMPKILPAFMTVIDNIAI